MRAGVRHPERRRRELRPARRPAALELELGADGCARETGFGDRDLGRRVGRPQRLGEEAGVGPFAGVAGVLLEREVADHQLLRRRVGRGRRAGEDQGEAEDESQGAFLASPRLRTRIGRHRLR